METLGQMEFSKQDIYNICPPILYFQLEFDTFPTWWYHLFLLLNTGVPLWLFVYVMLFTT